VVCVVCVVCMAITFICAGSRADTDSAGPGELHLCSDRHNWCVRRHTSGALIDAGTGHQFRIRQLTDVFAVQLAAPFVVQSASGAPLRWPALPGEQSHGDQRRAAVDTSSYRPGEEPMNMTAPAATTGNHVDQDLMTRRQVAYLFRVTSAAVASWARRGRLLEVRNQAGRPRYRRADVEALFRRGSGRAA
jgi:hypothetical protein